MRMFVAVFSLLVLTSVAHAQERFSEEKAQRAAAVLAEAAGKVEGLQHKSEVDTSKANGLKADEFAALFIPAKDLTEEAITKLGTEIKPVGQLWLLGLAPAINGEVISNDKLRVITVQTGSDEKTVSLYLVGVKLGENKKPTLVIYAKEKEPILTLPLTEAKQTQDLPVVIDGKKVGDDAGDVTIQVFGKHEAAVRVKERNP